MPVFTPVERPVIEPDWREFIERELLATAVTGKAVQLLSDEPKRQMRRLRSLFSLYGFGAEYVLHIKVEDDCLTCWVSRR